VFTPRLRRELSRTAHSSIDTVCSVRGAGSASRRAVGIYRSLALSHVAQIVDAGFIILE
jgi:hypothetical protein